MTFEKWTEEITKGQIFRSENVKAVVFELLDIFGQEYDEEEFEGTSGGRIGCNRPRVAVHPAMFCG
jgi:hypothetical protein